MSANMKKFQICEDFDSHTVDMTKKNQLVKWVEVLADMREYLEASDTFTLGDMVAKNEELDIVQFPNVGEPLANVRYYSGPLQDAGVIMPAPKVDEEKDEIPTPCKPNIKLPTTTESKAA